MPSKTKSKQKRNPSKIVTQIVKQNKAIEISADVILEACGNDVEVVVFFVEWVKQNRSAKLAYQLLHPDVTERSAEVLGSRMLSRVDKTLILQAYGLTAEKYINVLNQGLEAERWNEFTGEREADHRARKPFHDKLGQLLKWETKESVNVQTNIQNIVVIPSDLANKYQTTDPVRSTETDSK